jgi:hypothetical protein
MTLLWLVAETSAIAEYPCFGQILVIIPCHKAVFR